MEEEDLGLRAEEARLKYEEEEQTLRLKAEEEAQLAEVARLKVEDHQRTRLKMEERVLLTLETIQQA